MEHWDMLFYFVFKGRLPDRIVLVILVRGGLLTNATFFFFDRMCDSQQIQA